MNRPTKPRPRRPIEPAMIDRKLVEKVGKEHRIEFPTAEKALWLTRVLHAISTSKIGKDFALMGGSAIVFLYRNLYRFSTDLDLDFIGNKNLGKRGQHEIKTLQQQHRKVLQRLARDLGLTFIDLKPGNDRFIQYRLEYRSGYTKRGEIEIDISYRYCHSVLGSVSHPWPFTLKGVVPAFKVQSLRQEELYASKVTAMLEGKERLDFPGHIGLMFKRKIRHLFDVSLLANDVANGEADINIELLHNLVVLFGLTRIKNFEYFRGDAIGIYTKSDVDRELRSVVPQGTPIETVEVMKWEVRKFFDKHLFNWSDAEHHFIEDFKAGNFRPEDLFGAGAVAKELRGMHYYKEILGKVKAIES